MSHWKRVILLGVLLVSGCATTQNYDKMLNSFVGRSVHEVLLKWGEPQKNYSLPDGTNAIEYITSRHVDEYVNKPYIPEYSGTSYLPPDVYIATPDIYRKILWCRTKFIVDQRGMVISWSHEGNDCKK
jgi:glutathione peroxidase-family protein